VGAKNIVLDGDPDRPWEMETFEGTCAGQL